MSTPSHEDSWDAAVEPSDPSTLPPGFYFAPGTGPNAAPRARSGAVKWIVAVVVVLVLVGAAVGIAVFVL